MRIKGNAVAGRASSKRRKSAARRTPYSKATDDEKVARNWGKALGLFERGEYSVAVIRCGTCIELALNFAIRQELVQERELPLPFVNKILLEARGLQNKYNNLFLPLMQEYEQYDELRELWKRRIVPVNTGRNSIVHSGEFRTRSVAQSTLGSTYHALQEIMNLYDHGSTFKPFKK